MPTRKAATTKTLALQFLHSLLCCVRSVDYTPFNRNWWRSWVLAPRSRAYISVATALCVLCRVLAALVQRSTRAHVWAVKLVIAEDAYF